MAKKGKEIATELNIPVGNVHVILKRVRDKLREELRALGVDEIIGEF